MEDFLFRARKAIQESLRSAFFAWCMLMRAMVPVMILIKVLSELDLLRFLVVPFRPVMALVNLPPELAVAWISSLCINLYAGLFVYVDILKTLSDPVSVAQATTFATMSLIAHNIFAEGKVVQYCGLSMTLQVGIRICAALVFGLIFSHICLAFGWLSQPAEVLYKPSPAPESLWLWALLEIRSYFMLLLIISGLMLVMRFLKAIRVVELINSLLGPVFRLMGISPGAATITVVGLTTGIAYGGGLIISEVRNGTLQKREVFTSLTFMGLAHAMVEDTLIMIALGASMSGIFWGRLLFAFLVMLILARILRRFPVTSEKARAAPAAGASQ